MTDPRDQNDDLRQLFADATSDVRPRGSLDDILDRAKKVDPMAQRWFMPVVAAAAVIGFVIGGAVWLANDPSGPKDGHGPVTTPTSGTGGREASVPVYYVGEDAHSVKLYREFQRMQICENADVCLLEAAARQAVAGVPDDPDYRNPWPAGTTVKGATWDGNVITVDLHAGSSSIIASADGLDPDQLLAVQQLIYSAQAGLGKGRVPVQLLLDGAKVPSIRGVATEAPILAEDEADILAPVQISSPANGATVPAGDLKVTGVASTFEANVVWELMVGGDTVVQEGHTTAQECCTLAPYEFTVKDLQPGTYTLAVHDTDESGEGRAVNQDTKEIVVK